MPHPHARTPQGTRRREGAQAPENAQAPEAGASPGLLITHVHRYNLLVTLLFAGRRRALDAALAEASGAAPGEQVLDVGSGPGRFARALARRVGPRGRVTGVDPAGEMVAYARRHARRLPNCRFHVAAAQDLDLPDASVDVVTSTFVLHHIPAEARPEALAHMHRVLRPGGRLLLADAYPTGRLGTALAQLLHHRAARHAVGAEGDQEVDPFADTDVRRQAGTLRALGFGRLRLAELRPWTRFLTAVKEG